MAKTLDHQLTTFEAEAQKKRSKQQRVQEISDIRVVMNTIEGRRLLYRILEKSHCFSTIFSGEALVLAHNSGFQDCGFYVQSEIQEATIPLYFRMLREGLQDREVDADIVAEVAKQLQDAAASSGHDTEA